MDELEVLAAFGVYDPRWAQFGELAPSQAKLAKLTAHFCEGKKFTIESPDPPYEMRETETSPPYFTNSNKTALEQELVGVLPIIKSSSSSIVSAEKCTFVSIIRAFLKVDSHRIAFPQTTRLLLICLSIPLITCSVERLFSKLKIVKDRLSNKMGDKKLQEYLLQSVQGQVTADGIPKEVLAKYIDAFVSEERRLSFLPYSDLLEAQELSMEVRRSHEKSWWI